MKKESGSAFHLAEPGSFCATVVLYVHDSAPACILIKEANPLFSSFSPLPEEGHTLSGSAFFTF